MMTKKGKPTELWRYADGAVPNSLAIGYVFFGHLAGLYAITVSSLVLNLFGTLLIASTLIIAGYLIHELAHSLVFKSRRNNTRFGEMLSWLCGSSYASFDRIRSMHLRHHADRADIACFNHEDYIRSAPGWLRRTIFAAEWLHLPAVELVMHLQVIVRPFRDERYHYQRGRVIATGLSRLLFFCVLFSLNPWSLLFFAIAYLIFLKALFLAEVFAHTYEMYFVSHHKDPVPRDGRNAAYDREHTYSNVVSRRFPWLNLYNLNFGYHNAHHDKPATPWYRLPALQAELYDDGAPQYLPYREVMVSFHKNRTRCILASEHTSGIGEGKGRADGFLGVHGVSFLSIV
jgi:fatty acid desaturase